MLVLVFFISPPSPYICDAERAWNVEPNIVEYHQFFSFSARTGLDLGCLTFL